VSAQTLTVLAVDDERPALADLARLLRDSPSVHEVACARSGSEALRQLAQRQFDALFLDVRMPGLSGLELAGVLDQFATPPVVVLVSAYSDAAARAFEVHATDYLMKPVSRRRMEQAVTRVAEALVGRTAAGRAPVAGPNPPAHASAYDQFVAVERVSGRGRRVVRRDAILYVQARGDFVRLFTEDGRFLQRRTLADVESRWRAHGFHRVHRAYIVNLQHAVELRPEHGGTATMVLTDGSEIPVARRQVAELRRRFNA
jgi:DNA-binding LytR/AlgR family response regulator